MTGWQLIGTLIVGVGIWIIGTFYWLRMAAAALLLIGWAAFSVFAPIYILYETVRRGDLLQGVATVAASLIPAFLFAIVFLLAVERVRRDLKMGTFWMPWNARD